MKVYKTLQIILEGEIHLSKTIALAGTLDSKGKEFSYVKEVIDSLGFDTLLINTGVFPSEIEADVSNAQVAEAAGVKIEQLAKQKDRAEATREIGRASCRDSVNETACAE